MRSICSQPSGPTALLAAIVAAVLAGCGSDSSGGGDLGDGGGRPGEAVSNTEGVVLSVLPDLSNEPLDVVFAAVPDLLVTDDGRVIYAPPERYAARGELVADVWVQAISPEGVEQVRDAIAAGDPLDDIADLTTLVGPALGGVERYLPDAFRFAAIEIGPVAEFHDADTPLVEWPDTASVALADVDGCVRLPELEVGEAFATAAENSAFVEDGVIYGVVAAPVWPGAPCTFPD